MGVDEVSPTVQTLLLGFATLAIFVALGWFIGRANGRSKALRAFFPVWLVYCLWHLSVGMGHGYSLASELPFLLLNFGAPALLAWWLLRTWR